MDLHKEVALKKRLRTGFFRIWVVLYISAGAILFTIGAIGARGEDMELGFAVYSGMTISALAVGYLIIRMLVAAYFWIVKGFRGAK